MTHDPPIESLLFQNDAWDTSAHTSRSAEAPSEGIIPDVPWKDRDGNPVKAKYLEGSYIGADGRRYTRNGKPIGKARNADPGNTPSRPTQRPAPAPSGASSMDAALNDLRSEYATPDPSQATQAPAPAGPPKFIFAPTGAMLLTVSDATVPTALQWYMRRRGRADVHAKDLRLDKDEREQLQPMAEPAAQYLLQHMNPLVLFLVSMAGIYAAKIPQDPAPRRTQRSNDRYNGIG